MFDKLIVIVKWLYPYILGYGFSVIVGSCCMRRAMKPLWATVQSEGVSKEITETYSKIFGYIESFLYTTALLLSYPSFIGIWLAFKLAGRWERAKKQFEELYNDKVSDDIKGTNKMKAHAIYCVFIIGSGLNIIYAVIGYKMIIWMRQAQNLQLSQQEKCLQCSKVIVIPLLVIIATLILWKFAKHLPRKWEYLKYKCSLCGQEFYTSAKKIICLECFEKYNKLKDKKT